MALAINILTVIWLALIITSNLHMKGQNFQNSITALHVICKCHTVKLITPWSLARINMQNSIHQLVKIFWIAVR